MKRSRFTDEQIVFALNQQEVGSRLIRSVASWEFRMQLSTNGRKSTRGW